VARAASGVVGPRDDIVTETRAEAGKPVPPPAAASAAPLATPDAAKKATVVAKPAAPAPPAADAARAKALLEGKEAAPAIAKADEARNASKDTKEEAGRYVLQVGAFADAGAARETRSKVEKLGLKTYTQVVETAAGSRTRVRVGPFASRDEADKALAKARDAGISAVVLTL
jgi:DedD protein